MPQFLFKAKYYKGGSYQSIPGEMAKLKCANSFTQIRCPCAFRILILEIDEHKEEILDPAYVKQTSKQLHSDKCEYFSTNVCLQIAINSFDEWAFEEKVETLRNLIKEKKGIESSSSDKSIEVQYLINELEEYKSKCNDLEQYKLKCVQLTAENKFLKEQVISLQKDKKFLNGQIIQLNNNS